MGFDLNHSMLATKLSQYWLSSPNIGCHHGCLCFNARIIEPFHSIDLGVSIWM